MRHDQISPMIYYWQDIFLFDSDIWQWSHPLMIPLHCLWAKSSNRPRGQFDCDMTLFLLFLFDVVHSHAPCGCCSIDCSKIRMKCTLDNLKITVLRLKINLAFCYNTKSRLIWSFKLSRTVTKLFKQYDWVIWLISADILKCKFRYVMVRYEKLSLGELTRVSILLTN